MVACPDREGQAAGHRDRRAAVLPALYGLTGTGREAAAATGKEKNFFQRRQAVLRLPHACPLPEIVRSG